MMRHAAVLLLLSSLLVFTTQQQQGYRWNLAGQRMKKMDSMEEMEMLLRQAEGLVSSMHGRMAMPDDDMRLITQNMQALRDEEDAMPVIQRDYVPESNDMKGFLGKTKTWLQNVNQLVETQGRAIAGNEEWEQHSVSNRFARWLRRAKRVVHNVVGEPESERRETLVMTGRELISLAGNIANLFSTFSAQ